MPPVLHVEDLADTATESAFADSLLTLSNTTIYAAAMAHLRYRCKRDTRLSWLAWLAWRHRCLILIFSPATHLETLGSVLLCPGVVGSLSEDVRNIPVSRFAQSMHGMPFHYGDPDSYELPQ